MIYLFLNFVKILEWFFFVFFFLAFAISLFEVGVMQRKWKEIEKKRKQFWTKQIPLIRAISIRQHLVAWPWWKADRLNSASSNLKKNPVKMENNEYLGIPHMRPHFTACSWIYLYIITSFGLTSVWKVQNKWHKYGCFVPSANTLRSISVHSTSSSSRTTSFFKHLTA